MKYLLVEDKVNPEQVILGSIAEFLWDNGNEVYTSNNLDDRIDYLNIVECCNCIVLLILKDSSTESIFRSAQEVFRNSLGKNINEKLVVVFSTNAVYCNAIPFPHKIFQFEGLNQNELTRFFSWCRKLNLFSV